MSHAITVQNRTPRVLAYEQRCQAIEALRRSAAPEDKKAYAEMRRQVVASVSQPSLESQIDQILQARQAGADGFGLTRTSPSDVHAVSFMANMSVQYANEAYIGDELLPIVPVAKLSDEFAKYGKRDALAAPDDAMGGRSTANEVFDSRTSDSYTCKPYGLKKAVEKKTVDNEDAVFDEMMDLSAQVSELMAFKREKRAMTILTDSANYGSNTSAIAAADRWDTALGGDPVKTIRTAKEAVWRGMGASRLIGFCPLSVYITLCTNPAILDLTKYTKGGTVPRQVLAELFELDDLLVAKAWEDTANEGQTASYSRMATSAIFGIVRVANSPSKRNVSFGYNFRFKGEVNNLSWYEAKEGTRGVYYNQQTVDEVNKIVAADAAYLLTTVTG